VLLTTVYYRTNLTFRQIALLFGISRSAANRVVEHIAPPLVTGQPFQRRVILFVLRLLGPTTRDQGLESEQGGPAGSFVASGFQPQRQDSADRASSHGDHDVA
jgi:hypothetical protein